MTVSFKRHLARIFLIVVALLVLFTILLWYLIAQPIFVSPASVKSESFDSAELRSQVDYIVKNFYPRNEENPENLRRCAQYIHETFLQATVDVHYQKFLVNGVEYRNVIASFGPQQGERLIVGAHYDAAGGTPGADDNATGVAALIALSKKLKDTQLKHRIDLVAYTLEEPPHFRTKQMGSAWHAMEMQEKNIAVKLMISLEMLGFYSSQPDSQSYPLGLLSLYYPTKGNFIAVVGRMGEGSVVKRVKELIASATEADVYSINAPRLIPGIDFSDHLNYWDEGFPAVMVSDTAFYRNQAYHTNDDQIDILDFDTMASVLSGIYHLILHY